MTKIRRYAVVEIDVWKFDHTLCSYECAFSACGVCKGAENICGRYGELKGDGDDFFIKRHDNCIKEFGMQNQGAPTMATVEVDAERQKLIDEFLAYAVNCFNEHGIMVGGADRLSSIMRNIRERDAAIERENNSYSLPWNFNGKFIQDCENRIVDWTQKNAIAVCAAMNATIRRAAVDKAKKPVKPKVWSACEVNGLHSVFFDGEYQFTLSSGENIWGIVSALDRCFAKAIDAYAEEP